MIFFNIFTFLFTSLGVFNYRYDPDTGNYDINTTDDGTIGSSSQVFTGISGLDPGEMFSLFFVDFDQLASLSGLVSIALIGGAIGAAFITRSPAPFVLFFIANVMKNFYVRSQPVFEHYPINGYIMLACIVGMVILFIITGAETLTHGDV
jgi:hypothetical protein